MYKALISGVVSERGFITEFSQDAQRAAESAARETSRRPQNGRADLRDLPFVTIDGADAHDFDDAVYCRPADNSSEDGSYFLTVAIADVSAYVPPQTPLDDEARARGTSVYLPDRVIPMLPHCLSGGSCSLLPGEDRLCLCCEMEVRSGDIHRYRFFRAVIRSAKRLTYDEASAIMRGDSEQPLPSPAPPALAALPLLWQVAEQFRQKRAARGSMLLERPEQTLTVTDKDELQAGLMERHLSHWAIEEAMLAANRCAADFIIQKRYPSLHRTHARPTAEKVALLQEALSPLRLSLPSKPRAADFAAVMEAAEARDPELANVLLPLVLGTLARAEYAPDENTGHFGLACARYTHFTSPIRRYPDLITHRVLLAALADAPPPMSPDALRAAGEHCTAAEVNADKATWECRQRLLCVAAQDKLGYEYEGYVSGVTSHGVFVTAPALGIDGMVRLSTLPGYWQSDVKKRLVVSPDGQVWSIGHKINVQVSSIVPEKGRVDFLASDYTK